MKKFDEYSKIVDLLVRSLQGDISADEQTLINAWRKDNPANEAMYHRILSDDFWKRHPQQQYQGEIVTAWMRLYERRQRQESRLRLRRRLRVVAAVAVLVVGCSALWQIIQWQRGDGSIIRKSKFPPNPERSVQFSGKRTKRSVQKKGCAQHL